jgi:isopentenyl phosphate kinase
MQLDSRTKLVFIKLGGSLITDKRNEKHFRAEIMQRLANEIAMSLHEDPSLRLLIGHGSGSFGHVTASKFGTIYGARTEEQWQGFAEVATVAAELNALVARALVNAQVPIWRLQPSASALCQNGKIVSMELGPVRAALEHHLVPLVYGDVSLDSVRGGTIISTETIFQYLAVHFPVQEIYLLGEVAGVLEAEGRVIPEITPATVNQYQTAIAGSTDTDVTGGMFSKVMDMLELTRSRENLTIRIFDGREPDLLFQTLIGTSFQGTLIRSD